MKRLLPLLLIVLTLVALLISCGPEDVPTTTFEEPITEPETTQAAAPVITTTKKKLGMGISEADEGWSFWGDY